jgi:hypothetical protein
MLTQRKYASDLLTNFGLEHVNPVKTIGHIEDSVDLTVREHTRFIYVGTSHSLPYRDRFFAAPCTSFRCQSPLSFPRISSTLLLPRSHASVSLPARDTRCCSHLPRALSSTMYSARLLRRELGGLQHDSNVHHRLHSAAQRRTCHLEVQTSTYCHALVNRSRICCYFRSLQGHNLGTTIPTRIGTYTG